MHYYNRGHQLGEKNHEGLIPTTYKEYLQINSMKAIQFKIWACDQCPEQ